MVKRLLRRVDFRGIMSHIADLSTAGFYTSWQGWDLGL